MLNKYFAHKLMSVFNKFLRFFCEHFTKFVLLFILCVIIIISCALIIDQRSFCGIVGTSEIEKAKKEGSIIVYDSTTYINELSKIEKDCYIINSDKEILIQNNNAIDSASKEDSRREDSLFDIISKSTCVLNSKHMIFCAFLFGGLLAFLLFKIGKMNELVAQNNRFLDENKKLKEIISTQFKEKNDELLKISKEANDKLQELNKYFYKVTNILTRIESVFNMSIIIGNVTTSLKLEKTEDEKYEISLYIANLCSQLSSLSLDIDTCLNTPETKLDYLTPNETSIIIMYLEDTLDALKRCLDIVNAKDINILELSIIIENNRRCVEDIKYIIDSIEVKNEYLRGVV